MSGLANRGGRRTRHQRWFHNRVLIGSVTVLVLLVGVVIAFQTQNSVPFVPHYTLHLQMRNAEELTRGGEVHMGGSLVGFVTTVEAAHAANDTPIAVVTVQLDHSVDPLPRSTRFTIRLKGAIGTKYIDVALGHGGPTWPTGATVPLSRTGAAVDLDTVLDMFNAATRTGVQKSTEGLGDALAGRGGDINSAIGALQPLVTRLAPVMSTLAAPGTHLTGFIRGLAALSSALAPVAGAQGELVDGLDGTFRALSAAARPYLEQAISDTPGALDTVTAGAPTIDTLARSTATLLRTLNPGLATVPATAPVVADALAAANANLPGTAALDRRITSLAGTLAAYSANPTVTAGLSRLSQTASSLAQPLAFLTPVQTRCDYITTLLHNVSSSLSDNVGNGTVLRFVLVAIDDVTGSEAVPSHTPYTGTGTSGGSHHGPLHTDAYPDTSSPGQPAICSAGNEHYSASHAQIGPANS